jgi:hypothetical protein
MRTSLVSVLAALVSIASTIPIGYGAHHGQVAARDPAKVRSPPVTPIDLERNVPRAAHPDRRDFAPRAQPSKKPDRRDYAPRAEPSKKPARRDYVPRAAEPSKKPDRRDHVPRAEPSKKNERRDYAPRAEPSKKPERRDQDAHAPTKRSPSQQIQDLFWKKLWEGSRWGFVDDEVDQCPAPLSACPVRGARDADAIECVDLESDLYSCGGCAADDILCVVFFLPLKNLSLAPFLFLTWSFYF